MQWHDTAQARHMQEAYNRRQAEAADAATPSEPATEADALQAYKRAHYLVPELRNRKQIRALEQIAAANGWDSIAEHKQQRADREAAAAERDKIQQRDADERAAMLTTRQEAAALYQSATDNGDTQLATSIKNAANTKGWNLMPTNPADVAAQTHDALMDIISAHDLASVEYRDDLRARRVTPEYVKERLAAGTNTSRARLTELTTQAANYVNDAQADYDALIAGITTTPGDTNAQLLSEIRDGKEWDRQRRELDALPDAKRATALMSRIAHANPDTLRVLMSEAPSYLAANGIADADTLVQSAVHEALPSLKEAQARINEAARLRDTITHDVRLIGNYIDNLSMEDTNTDNILGYVTPARVLD